MNYVLSDKYQVSTGKASKGCQIKYFRNGYWYKIDGINQEGLNEHVVSLLLKCSSVKNYVYYERCTVNQKHACRSYSFTNDREEFRSLSNIIKSVYGANAENTLGSIQSITGRYNFIVKAVWEYTGGTVDFRKPLQEIFYLDMLVLNRDRHLNNLGVIYNASDEMYRPAPIFDNGLSLMAGCQGDVFEYGIDEAIRKQSARTISGSFINQCMASTGNQLQKVIYVNFNKLNKLLDEEGITENSYVRKVLNYRIHQLGKLYEA